jgi:hypothetical protein
LEIFKDWEHDPALVQKLVNEEFPDLRKMIAETGELLRREYEKDRKST